MNRAKAGSKVDGRAFMSAAFAAEQQVLTCQLKLSAASITHDGVMGSVTEQHFIAFLRRSLPLRYAVDSAVVIDSNGATSDQIDIVIYDRQYTPTLLDQQCHRYVPAEAVYAAIEVKPKLSKTYLDYAGDKIKSVRCLERTSVAIVHAGGHYDPKLPSPILGGVVALEAGWKEGLGSRAFLSLLKKLPADKRLDVGLALVDGAFDNSSQDLAVTGQEGALAFFVFRLLQRLQACGTVGATDWNRYAAVLGKRDA